jgi:CRISPR-associated protein Cmr6
MKFDYPIPVPKDAMKALGQLDKQPTNPGLLFDRFTPDLHDTHVEDKEKSKWKNDALKAISNHPADKEALDNYKARWELVIAQAHATSFPMRTDWRFIAGLGRKGALEVGFTFHRYGFPILPGSSVKGIARALAFYEIAGKLNLEGEALSDLDEALSEDNDIKHAELMSAFPSTDEAKALVTEFRKVFGTTGNAGGAVFFDAIPVAPPRLELDIMNPHYPKYYSGEEYPTNWQSPVPVFFLTVAANQEFSFAVGWRGKYDKEAETIRGKAEEYLKAGLTDLGAGAKTSAGYGYFKPAS